MTKQTRRRPARRRPAARRASTALMRRPAARLRAKHPGRSLGDGVELGALGLVELKLTPDEEGILDAPVDPGRVLWRPRKKDGPPEIPYLPHQDYTRWFNKAFGRTGWALVPVAKPSIAVNEKLHSQTITCPYVLHVHGQPVAFAVGEQEYYETNEQQTYGDALESTVASALRRCAKRLGVGLELWDKRWIAAQLGRSRSRPAPAARPARASAPRPPAPARETPAAGHDGRADALITDKQRQRLWVIIRNSGRSEEEIRDWLMRRYGSASTKVITRREYDFVCRSIESTRDLPEREREPGTEG